MIECYFITILLMWALLHNKLWIIKSCEFEVSWSTGCVWDPLLWGGLDAIFGSPWNVIHFNPCRNPCRYFIHSNFLGPFIDFNDHGPSSSKVRRFYRFIFRGLQLLTFRCTQQNLCCISKSMKYHQNSNWMSILPWFIDGYWKGMYVDSLLET